MRWLEIGTVCTTPTDSGIQRRNRSSKTSDRAAAGMQPKSPARGAVDGDPSRVLSACAAVTEV
jgi:hypothetical protein